MTGPDTDGTSKPSSAVDTNGPVTKSPPTANFLVVLGMHRSGTSALAGLLNAAGAGVSSELLDEQPEINRKGFWEDSAIVGLNDRLLAEQNMHWFDWQRLDYDRLHETAEGKLGLEAKSHLTLQYLDEGISVCKDPRFCRTLPFWKRCFSDAGLQPAYFLCLRHPAEVAASLQKRDALHPVYGTLLWMSYTLDALTALEGDRFLALDYTEVLESPSTVVQRVNDLAGGEHRLNLQQRNVEDAVDAKLRHHFEHEQTLLMPGLQRESESLHRVLRGGAGEPRAEAATAASAYLNDNLSLWPLIADLALNTMRQSGNLVEIGEKHQRALDVIGKKDDDIAGLGAKHAVALETIAERDVQLQKEIAWRDVQLQKEIAWREHLERELRKYQSELAERQAELAELNEGLLAMPVRLRRKWRDREQNR